jgi:WD40 repeat protein
VDMETGVVDGRFIGPQQLVVGLDSGGLVLVTLTKERDGDRLTHYLEVQNPVVEHDEQMLGLDLWPEGGDCLVASVGADLRLNVWGPSLNMLHSYLPAHERLITGVSCSPTEPHTLATASQDGTVKVWDTRQSKPCQTVHKSPLSPPSCLTWSGHNLVVGTRSGALLTLDTRTPGTEPMITSQFFDREVRRLRWNAAGKQLAVTADDSVVKVVEVRDTAVVEVYQDRRHKDYVRGLAWSGDNLWSAGWDTQVFSHTIQ